MTGCEIEPSVESCCLPLFFSFRSEYVNDFGFSEAIWKTVSLSELDDAHLNGYRTESLLKG
jgi:hypothetical protein